MIIADSVAGDRPRAVGDRVGKWLLVAILACALGVRLYGINWDDGLLFHPDERQLLMVVDEISFPGFSDLELLFSPESPWNPRFFSYGSLPIYVLRVALDVLTPLFEMAGFEIEPYLVGRFLSAISDTFAVLLIYLLGRRLVGVRTGLVAACLTCFTVLHIQLAHFYTVDVLLTTLVLLTLYVQLWAMDSPTTVRAILGGACLGLAVATKLSAAPLGFCVFLGFAIAPSELSGIQRWLKALYLSIISALASLIVFFVFEPYALIDMGRFMADVIYESGMASGLFDVPYTRQFLGTTAYWYQLKQAFVWSAGPLLTSLAAAGTGLWLVTCLWQQRREQKPLGGLVLLLVWMFVYFALVGRMQARFLRYMLPILPIWSLMAAFCIEKVIASGGILRWLGYVLLWLGIVVTALTGISYLHIYSEPHTWVQTTNWFNDLPQDRVVVVCEAWDDNVPILRSENWDWSTCIEWSGFDSYQEDSSEKMTELATKLASADYVVLPSQRLYATIGRLPERYPLNHAYLTKLFNGQLGYELAYTTSVYPALFGIDIVNDTFMGTGLPVPALVDQQREDGLLLGRADESYDVYDHPMPLVFYNSKRLSRQELQVLLLPEAGGR